MIDQGEAVEGVTTLATESADHARDAMLELEVAEKKDGCIVQ